MTESYAENDIIQKLSTQFPFLTKKELKLCIYFRLNFSSKEISSLDISNIAGEYYNITLIFNTLTTINIYISKKNIKII